MIYPLSIIISASCSMISVNSLPFPLSNNSKVHDSRHFTIPKNSKLITPLKAPLIITVKVIPIFKTLSSLTSKKINSHLPNKSPKINKNPKIKSEFPSNFKIKFNSTGSIQLKNQTIWSLMIVHNIPQDCLQSLIKINSILTSLNKIPPKANPSFNSVLLILLVKVKCFSILTVIKGKL